MAKQNRSRKLPSLISARFPPENFRCVPQHLPAALGWGAPPPDGGVGANPRNAAGLAKEGATPPALPGGGRTPPAPLRARAVRGALGAASCPAPPGPAPGAGCGRVPPAGSGAGGTCPVPPCREVPNPGRDRGCPAGRHVGGPHRGRKEPEPEAEPPLPRRAQPGTHPRETGRRQRGHRERAAPLFQGVLLLCFFFFFSRLLRELHCNFFNYYFHFPGIFLDGLCTAPCPHGHARLRSRHAAM